MRPSVSDHLWFKSEFDGHRTKTRRRSAEVDRYNIVTIPESSTQQCGLAATRAIERLLIEVTSSNPSPDDLEKLARHGVVEHMRPSAQTNSSSGDCGGFNR